MSSRSLTSLLLGVVALTTVIAMLLLAKEIGLM
jgi:hypothetical protein